MVGFTHLFIYTLSHQTLTFVRRKYQNLHNPENDKPFSF